MQTNSMTIIFMKTLLCTRICMLRVYHIVYNVYAVDTFSTTHNLKKAFVKSVITFNIFLYSISFRIHFNLNIYIHMHVCVCVCVLGWCHCCEMQTIDVRVQKYVLFHRSCVRFWHQHFNISLFWLRCVQFSKENERERERSGGNLFAPICIYICLFMSLFMMFITMPFFICSVPFSLWASVFVRLAYLCVCSMMRPCTHTHTYIQTQIAFQRSFLVEWVGEHDQQSSTPLLCRVDYLLRTHARTQQHTTNKLNITWYLS